MALYIRHSAGSVRKGRGPNDRDISDYVILYNNLQHKLLYSDYHIVFPRGVIDELKCTKIS